MKRRICAALLAVMTAFALAGCGAVLDKDKNDEKIASSSANEKFDLKTANAYAKASYNAAAEYLCDCANKGISTKQSFDNGDFALANSSEGFDTSENTGSIGEGDKKIAQWLKSDCDETGIVYIGIYADKDGKDTFFIQFKGSKDSKVIGQYPDEIETNDRDKVVWGEHFEK